MPIQSKICQRKEGDVQKLKKWKRLVKGKENRIQDVAQSKVFRKPNKFI